MECARLVAALACRGATLAELPAISTAYCAPHPSVILSGAQAVKWAERSRRTSDLCLSSPASFL